MSVVLVFLAVLMGAVVWWLIKQTINVKPWAAPAPGTAVRDDGIRSPFTLAPIPSVKLGLVVLLAVVTSLFALFISAYSIRMGYTDWRPFPEPGALWGNTGILLLSSVFLQRGRNAAERNDLAGVRRGIGTGGVLAILFIAGQLLVWDQLRMSGYFPRENPAIAFFFLLTGAHAVHLAGGLVALGRSVRRAWAEEEDWESITLGTELCAVYWHYLFVVWLILFGLLLST